MTISLWILIGFSTLMYLEGIALATAIGVIAKPSKLVWPLLLLFWPVAIPVLLYKAYLKYQPLIQSLQLMQHNPLMGAMLGGPQNPLEGNPLLEAMLSPPKQQSPVAAILGSSSTKTDETTETTTDTTVSELPDPIGKKNEGDL